MYNSDAEKKAYRKGFLKGQGLSKSSYQSGYESGWYSSRQALFHDFSSCYLFKAFVEPFRKDDLLTSVVVQGKNHSEAKEKAKTVVAKIAKSAGYSRFMLQSLPHKDPSNLSTYVIVVPDEVDVRKIRIRW